MRRTCLAIALLAGFFATTAHAQITFRDATNPNRLHQVTSADPLPTTATITGGGDASAANQVTANGYLSTIATAVAGTGPTTTGNLAATLSMSTATTTKIITGVSAKSTYVTGYNITVDAATLVSVVYGTGTNCGTGTTTIAQHTFPANGGITIGVGMANILPAVAASTDVCITVSSSANTKINASYVQQ